MRIRKFAAISLLLLSSLAAPGVTPSKSQLESMYDKAFRSFDEAHYDEALQALDAIDERQPGLAESLNLRGVVYMRQGKYDKAETALRKALSIEPKFWNASFNLAEIPFLKKDWVEARSRFSVLMAGENDGLQPETSQLIQYKILLTFVLQGKESTVDWMLNKFELSKDSPALYYSNAAIALQHGNQAEAAEWRSAAEKKFSAPLNKLYAESFYEVGWLEKPTGQTRAALEIASMAERATRMKADAKANFEQAERAFQRRDFENALKFLDLAEEGAPNDAASDNLRGEILMEQGKYDEAEVALSKAFATDPKFREAQYNLAQIPFKKREYAKARDRLEALFGETPGGEKNQASQLIKFKIFMTLLLEDKDSEAQQLMDQFKFTGDTPALYYAQAAWEFKHAKAEQGNDWVASARKIYSPPLNIVFADSFYDLGWLKKPETEAAPTTSALAQADASPITEPRPAMRLGQAESLPAPALAQDGLENSTESSATSSAVAAAPPSSSAAPAAKPVARASVAPTITKVAAATPLAAAKAGRSSSTLAGIDMRVSDPQTLLIGGLLFAGVSLLAWLVVQQFRRSLAAGPLYGSSTPLSEPPFSGDSSTAGDERKVSRELLSSGPPKVSLQLKASEPSVRAAVLPSGAITARGATPPAEEKTPADAVPLRDQEEVSLPAVPAVFTEAVEPVAAAEKPAVGTPETAAEPAFVEFADLEEEQAAVETAAAASAPTEEPTWMQEEPVGQGQPIPELTTALSADPVISELTQPEPESTLELIEPGASVAASIAGRRPVQSSIETPSFASKIITTEPIRLQPTIPVPMPETTITPAPAFRTPSPTMSVQQPVGGMHTSVQLTFSLEIASMQLTPTFKMSGLQLKPTSKVVSMRLAPSQDPQPPMNLQVTFEVAKIELSGGTIGTVRLAPSSQEKPAALSSPSFAISGLELVAGAGSAPVQLTPSHQEQASVHLTAQFQIAAIEFSPLFEIAAIVLNSSSKNVSMQLPGSGPSSIDNAPVFQIESVQLGGSSELGLIQVTPVNGGRLT